MSTILIGGYYGTGNLGDEAILECMLKDMRALRNDLHFIVTSWSPEETSHTFNVEAVHWQDISALLEVGRRANLILLGGGGLFQDYFGIAPDTYLRRTAFTITTYGSLPLLAKLLDVPCMIYAQGIGPLKSELAREHVRLAFERCQVITLRDKNSLTLLQDCGFSPTAEQRIEITADPAFALETDPSMRQQAKALLAREGIPPEVDILSVSLRYWDEKGTDWIKSIAASLDAYLAMNNRAHILLLPFQVNDRTPYTDDRPVLQQVEARISHPERVHLFQHAISPRLMQAIFEHSALVLGMRLHALILAINANVPVIALPYDPKIKSVLEEVELEEYGLPSLNPSPGEFLSVVDRILQNKEALYRHLFRKREEQRQRALRNAQLALSLLDNYKHKQLSFSQEFALQNLRLIEKLDMEIEALRLRARALEEEVERLSTTLQTIQASRFWRLFTYYRRLRQFLRW